MSQKEESLEDLVKKLWKLVLQADESRTQEDYDRLRGQFKGLLDYSFVQRERMAWEAARLGRWMMFVWDGVATENQCFSFEYVNFDDWKKKPQSFDSAQDEREHLEKIRKEVEK